MMVQLNWKREQPPGRFAPNAPETTGKKGNIYLAGVMDLDCQGELGCCYTVGERGCCMEPKGVL